MEKKVIYVDMDDTICCYSSQHRKYSIKYPQVPYPQSIIGFFSSMEWYPGAKDALKRLEEAGYEIRILTRPSPYNLNSMTEKGMWVRDNMGFDYVFKLVTACTKSWVGEDGDYLVDDWDVHGQTDFKGHFLHFGSNGEYKDWEAILEYFEL